MPERSFGRTVRYRRTKLGLSQAKLAELVGRTTTTVRSWERDKSRPNDPQVLSALAAILGVDEKHLFDKADVDRPEEETSPTVEQALATLAFEDVIDDTTSSSTGEGADDEAEDLEPGRTEVPRPRPMPMAATSAEDQEGEPRENAPPNRIPEPARERDRELVAVGNSKPAYVAPPDPYEQTPLTPNLGDTSYMEDSSQRQLYRLRTLATLVALVALVIAFIWAMGEGVGALDAWWDEFFGNLRL